MISETEKQLWEKLDFSSLNFPFKITLEQRESNISFVAFMSNLAIENFTVGNLSISSRVLANWKQKSILPIKRDDRWNTFSFLEYCWLQIAIILRDFGQSLNMIKQVQKYLFQTLKRGVFEYEDYDPQQYQEFYDLNHMINPFTNLGIILSFIVFKRIDLSLIVYRDGSCTHVSNDLLGTLEGTFLRISLSTILRDFILEENYEKIVRTIGLINEQELEVINSIRAGDIQQLTIHFDRNQSVNLIEETRQETVDPAKRLAEIIMKDGYQEIIMKTEKGSIKSIKNIVKKKL
jgi:hypothetical protein